MKKEDFTAEEWQTLFNAPSMAGLAVTAASPSGPIGVMKEMFSVGMSLADLVKKKSDNTLIQALVEDVKKRGTKPKKPENVKNMEEVKTYALQQLQTAADILDKKNAGDEGEEFKSWLIDISQRTAEAAKEGGFLGFGGERVSSEEKAALNEISAILKG
ncbi:MAG: hypothetical protein DSY90_04390 [Deltaproteobacteria bacterium]|nr:MAG: hypothetical protein DSY90_04390 [Deltaproteobacteria bacterium]